MYEFNAGFLALSNYNILHSGIYIHVLCYQNLEHTVTYDVYFLQTSSS